MKAVFLMIGDNLKLIRESEKLNKRQMAQLLDLPYTTYNNYETGTRDPNSDILIKLSETFDVSVDFLLGRETNSKYLNDKKYIDKYQSLDDKTKKLVNIIIDFEYEQTQKRSAEKTETFDLTNDEKDFMMKFREIKDVDVRVLSRMLDTMYDRKDRERSSGTHTEEKEA